jgi:hypothetical protein
VSNNTFYGCYSPGSGSAVGFGSVFGSFHNNILSANMGSAAAGFGTTHQVTSTCNDYWGNLAGDIFGRAPDPSETFLDPLFCDPSNLDFTLHDDSPCAPGNNPSCGQVGAFGAACGSVSIESASWGKIKSLYR